MVTTTCQLESRAYSHAQVICRLLNGTPRAGPERGRRQLPERGLEPERGIERAVVWRSQMRRFVIGMAASRRGDESVAGYNDGVLCVGA